MRGEELFIYIVTFCSKLQNRPQRSILWEQPQPRKFVFGSINRGISMGTGRHMRSIMFYDLNNYIMRRPVAFGSVSCHFIPITGCEVRVHFLAGKIFCEALERIIRKVLCFRVDISDRIAVSVRDYL